jgi:hypothetical protein
LTHVVSSLAYPNLLGTKGLVVVVVVVVVVLIATCLFLPCSLTNGAIKCFFGISITK